MPATRLLRCCETSCSHLVIQTQCKLEGVFLVKARFGDFPALQTQNLTRRRKAMFPPDSSSHCTVSCHFALNCARRLQQRFAVSNGKVDHTKRLVFDKAHQRGMARPPCAAAGYLPFYCIKSAVASRLCHRSAVNSSTCWLGRKAALLLLFPH